MRLALLVAGALRGRALGTLVERRVAALRALGHDVIVAVPTTAPASDLDWLRGRGLEAVARSCREVCLELLPGAARPILGADAVYVVYGAYDPLLEAMRLFRTRPRLFEFAGLRAPSRGASLATCEAHAHAHARLDLARAATAVFAATADLTRDLAASIGVLEEDLAIAPLISPPTRAAAAALRQPENGRLLLATVGRPAPHKRLDVLVEGVARIRRTHPGVLLVVAGDHADAEAAAAREDALAWARALGVAEHVQFRGFLDDAALAGLLGSADAVVFGVDGSGHGLAAELARQLGCRVLGARSGAELAAAVIASRAVDAIHPASNDSGPAPWSDWLAAPEDAAAAPSLVPLLEHLERARTPYADALAWPVVGPGLSALRWKTVRHLYKFSGLVLERHLLGATHDAARALRALDRDVTALENALEPQAPTRAAWAQAETRRARPPAPRRAR